MEKHSDEWWESKGYKKVFLPQFNCFGWSIEIDFDMPASEMNNVKAIETLLEACVENEDYERAAELRDRLKELKAK